MGLFEVYQILLYLDYEWMKEIQNQWIKEWKKTFNKSKNLVQFVTYTALSYLYD